MKRYLKIKAFTLAEVLITLAIIGVVASLTIPSIIKNYKKHNIEVNLKSVYSLLAQAVNQSSIVNGNPAYWDYNLDNESFFNRYFMPYLKITKTCKSGYGTCFKKITKSGGDILGSGYQIGHQVILNNGMSLAFSNVCSGTVGCTTCLIFVDIDGPNKGQSRWGTDVFTFLTGSLWSAGAGNYRYKDVKKVNYFYPDGYGTTFKNAFSSSDYRGCTKATGGHHGGHCSAIIMQNGWRVPTKKEYKEMCPDCLDSNYPW